MGLGVIGCYVPYNRKYSRGEPVAIDPEDWTLDQTRNAGRVRFSVETDPSAFEGLMNSVDEIRGKFSDDDKPSRGAVLEAIVFHGVVFQREEIVEELGCDGFDRDEGITG
jgi:hypothetical protein